MKQCIGPCVGHSSCNWLNWMVVNDECPHCGKPVIELEGITPLGRMLDDMGPDGAYNALSWSDKAYDRWIDITRIRRWAWPRILWIEAQQIAAKLRWPYI